MAAMNAGLQCGRRLVQARDHRDGQQLKFDFAACQRQLFRLGICDETRLCTRRTSLVILIHLPTRLGGSRLAVLHKAEALHGAQHRQR